MNPFLLPFLYAAKPIIVQNTPITAPTPTNSLFLIVIVLSATLNPVGSKLDTSESIGNEYGVSKGSVVRLIRINKLTDELKALVDSGDIAIRTGVELSFLSEDTQAIVAECAEEDKIEFKIAKLLRASAESDGYIDCDTVHSIIYGDDSEQTPKPKSVKISNYTYTKYFAEGTKPKEITETIEKALEFYFKNNT